MRLAILHAVLRLLPSASGHRHSGWRAVCRFDGVTATDGAGVFGVEVQLPGQDHIEPGEEARCELHLWAAADLSGPIAVGTGLQLMEGTHEVARGEVTSFTEVVE